MSNISLTVACRPYDRMEALAKETQHAGERKQTGRLTMKSNTIGAGIAKALWPRNTSSSEADWESQRSPVTSLRELGRKAKWK